MDIKNVFKVQERLDKIKQKEKDLLKKLFKNKEQQRSLAFKLDNLKYSCGREFLENVFKNHKVASNKTFSILQGVYFSK